MNNVEIKINESDAMDALIKEFTDKVAAHVASLPDGQETPDSITIANNIIAGQRNSGSVRVRIFHVNVDTGEKQASNIVFDIALGKEERVNLTSTSLGFEVRPLVEGTSFASDDEVMPDAFGLKDAYDKLRAAVSSVTTIRQDMTLSSIDRDTKAAAAWTEALRLAQL